MRILVIGGNAAGLTAASRARRLDSSCSVTVLEASERIAYSICGLPFAISGHLSGFENLVIFTPERLRNERGIEALVNRRAIEVVPGRKRVVAENTITGEQQSHLYDKLLIATGYRPRSLPVEGMKSRGVFTASRLGDGEAILAWLSRRAARRAVLVGGGYVGLEMAEALAARGLHVTLVEASDRVFPALDPDMAKYVEEALAKNGVRVMTGRRVKRLTSNRDGAVEAVELEPGSLRLPADIVFVDVGVLPEVDLATEAGIALGPTGAIAVSDQMETSVSSIYAAGNCVETRHLVTGRPVSMPLGTVAAKQGRIAGENLVGRRSRFEGALGTTIVRVFDVAAARTGLGAEEAGREGFSCLTSTITGRFRAYYFDTGASATVKVIAERGSGRLLGAQIVGSSEGTIRIDVVAAAISGGLTVREASQLDLAYAPPLGALWNPLLVAMNQLLREL
ncbi:MAG TPA: FAD-dependent oxidoreductase [Vicinamibacteria bacterium]|nr:FAD-dependent oxidoreductase [Vicinamibacteria bacterium]